MSKNNTQAMSTDQMTRLFTPYAGISLVDTVGTLSLRLHEAKALVANSKKEIEASTVAEKLIEEKLAFADVAASVVLTADHSNNAASGDVAQRRKVLTSSASRLREVRDGAVSVFKALGMDTRSLTVRIERRTGELLHAARSLKVALTSSKLAKSDGLSTWIAVCDQVQADIASLSDARAATNENGQLAGLAHRALQASMREIVELLRGVFWNDLAKLDGLKRVHRKRAKPASAPTEPVVAEPTAPMTEPSIPATPAPSEPVVLTPIAKVPELIAA